MELVLALSLLLLVSAWYLLYWQPLRCIRPGTRVIPGPPGLPIIGNGLLFLGGMVNTLPTVLKLFRDYGPLVRTKHGLRVFNLMKDPDDIQKILGDPKIRNREGRFAKALQTFTGNGLLSLKGAKWQVHRKLISPTFHFKILESYVEVFGRKSTILIEKLNELNGKTFDVHPVLALCTLDAICETALGTAVNSQAVGKSNFVDALIMSLRFMHKRFIRPWLLSDFIFNLSADGRMAKPLVATMRGFSETVIAQKLSEYRKGVRSPDNTTASNKRVSSFLDMLIDASETQGSILSPDDIRDEVITLAAAGLETTATAMSFLLVLIANDAKVQAELHQELDEVFGSDDRPATIEDLPRLLVLDRCIKETLRLFPVVTLLPRDIDEDVLLPSGYTLPAGSSVVIFTYATHRDPRYYPDPEEFRPDRWLPDNSKKNHPYAYIPFSAGPRNCIGQKYAQLQMKSIISQILRRFRVSSPLTMKDLLNLDVSMTIGLDQELAERYRIQLHKR